MTIQLFVSTSWTVWFLFQALKLTLCRFCTYRDNLGGDPDKKSNEVFTDLGPADHGMSMIFNFGSLDVGESKTFFLFYGAAANELMARWAISAAGMEVWSIAKNSDTWDSDDPKIRGSPATFFFGYAQTAEDRDSDGVLNVFDNCPFNANAEQVRNAWGLRVLRCA